MCVSTYMCSCTHMLRSKDNLQESFSPSTMWFPEVNASHQAVWKVFSPLSWFTSHTSYLKSLLQRIAYHIILQRIAMRALASQ